MITRPFSFSHRLLPLLVIGFCLLGSPLPAGETTHLEEAVHKAISILRDPSLASPEKQSERREKLREVVYSEFDFGALSQGAVGHHWNKFSETQKSRFTDLFRRLLENTYMNTIERYKGEEVRFIKNIKQSSAVMRVDSLVNNKGAEFKVSYLLRTTDDQLWKVFDVVIEGVSVVANYRSQFKQMLRIGSAEEIEKMLGQLESTSNASE